MLVLLYTFAGALMVLAFSPTKAFWLAFVFCIPLLCLSKIEKAGTRFLLGYFFGLGFFCSGLFWLPSSAIIFFGFTPETSFFISVLLLAYLAVYPAIFAWLTRYAGDLGCFQVVVSWPLLWCALELLRSYIVGGVPWLGLGLSQLDGPLEGFFPIIGEIGVSYLVVLINGLLCLLIFNCREWAVKAFVSFVFILFSALVLNTITWTERSDKEVRAALIHAAIVQEGKWEPHVRERIVNEYRELSSAHLEGVDWLIWPETAVPFFSHQLKEKFPLLLEKVSRGGLVWLTGSLEQTIGGGAYNSLMVYSLRPEASYRKQVLVPFGEQLRFSYLVKFLGLPFSEQRETYVGQLPSLMKLDDVQVGASICWEIRFSELVAGPVIKGAEVLINVANEAWSSNPIAVLRSLQVSRVRAKEVGRPLLRASNRGWSVFVDHKGRVVKLLTPETAASMVVEFQGRKGLTPYLWLVANKGVWIILLVLFIAVVVERIIRRNRAHGG